MVNRQVIRPARLTGAHSEHQPSDWSQVYYDTRDSSFDWLSDVDISAWQWMRRAACLGSDTESFFEVSIASDTLKRICEECPVRQQCLDHAVKNDEYGYWGGTTRRERHKEYGGKRFRG